MSSNRREKNHYCFETMGNRKEHSTCVFYITGGNNQILPNVTHVIQNFYGDQFGDAALRASEPAVSVVSTSLSSDGEVPSEEVSDRRAIAEGELRIYYSDDASLQSIIGRIGNCRDASDLANLVVYEMMEHTILNSVIALKTHFIEALVVFIHFTKGSSVSNIRQHIRRQVSFALRQGKGSLY